MRKKGIIQNSRNVVKNKMRQIIRYPLNLKTLKLEIVTLGIQNFNALKITKLAVYIFAFKLEVMGFNKFI